MSEPMTAQRYYGNLPGSPSYDGPWVLASAYDACEAARVAAVERAEMATRELVRVDTGWQSALDVERKLREEAEDERQVLLGRCDGLTSRVNALTEERDSLKRKVEAVRALAGVWHRTCGREDFAPSFAGEIDAALADPPTPTTRCAECINSSIAVCVHVPVQDGIARTCEDVGCGCVNDRCIHTPPSVPTRDGGTAANPSGGGLHIGTPVPTRPGASREDREYHGKSATPPAASAMTAEEREAYREIKARRYRKLDEPSEWDGEATSPVPVADPWAAYESTCVMYCTHVRAHRASAIKAEAVEAAWLEVEAAQRKAIESSVTAPPTPSTWDGHDTRDPLWPTGRDVGWLNGGAVAVYVRADDGLMRVDGRKS
jgi:hypothetical protein